MNEWWCKNSPHTFTKKNRNTYVRLLKCWKEKTVLRSFAKHWASNYIFLSKPKTLLRNNYQKIIFINESKYLQIIGCNFVQYLQGGSWFRLFLFQFRWTHINYNSIAFSCIQILMYEKGKVLWKKYDDTYFKILRI